MKPLFFLLCATQAAADPSFINRAGTLPNPPVYAGEWEHFVGGGVSVFDCNGDTRPDIFAAGGTSPAALWQNEGDFAFTATAFPEILETTGAYPLDINGDGIYALTELGLNANFYRLLPYVITLVVLASALLFQERLLPVHLLGAATVVLGIYLLTR